MEGHNFTEDTGAEGVTGNEETRRQCGHFGTDMEFLRVLTVSVIILSRSSFIISPNPSRRHHVSSPHELQIFDPRHCRSTLPSS